MADEFPTLEVVLAACVLGLGWRGVSLVRALQGLDAAAERWASAVRAREPTRIAELEEDPAARWIAPLGRAALEDGSSEEPAASKPVIQRGARMAQRLRSAGARDLVVCAVLASSLVYALMTDLGASPIFFLLGLASAGLLLGSVVVRIRLASGLEQAAARLWLATRGARENTQPMPSGGELCSVCRAHQAILIASPDELGARLRDLGVEKLLVCPNCGGVEGRARAAKLGPPW